MLLQIIILLLSVPSFAVPLPRCNLEEYETVGPFKHGSQGSITVLKHRWSGMLLAQKTFKSDVDYQRELAALIRLPLHPNIITAVCHLDRLIVYEKAESNLLESMLSDIPSAVMQLISGVQAMHTVGMLHGDIKPLNAVITFDGRVKLIDFGFAGRQLRCHYGTRGFMAPELGTERCRDGQLTAAVDWYAVGVSVFMLYARAALPDGGLPDWLPVDPRTGIARNMPDTLIPMHLQDFIWRCMTPQPVSRLQRVMEWLSQYADNPNALQQHPLALLAAY